MAGGGRPRKPTKVLKRSGSRAAKKRQAEPTAPVARPRMPNPFPSRAKTMWNRLVDLLERLGILAEIDGAFIELFCRTWDDYRECVLHVQKHGRVFTINTREGNRIVKANPAAKLAIEYQRELVKIGNLFGLSPSARASLSVEQKPPAQTGAHESPAGRKLRKMRAI